MPLDTKSIRRQFPFLEKEDAPVYLDNAATTQKPQCVIEALANQYAQGTANAHRGVHTMGEGATERFEAARKTVADFVGANYSDEIVFTKNATEGINLLAHTLGESILEAGDTVVLSLLEHHANIVPWQQLQKRIGIHIEWVDCSKVGELDLTQLEHILKEHKVKLVSITGQSNVLGVRPDVKKIATLAHKHGAFLLVDAAQLLAHAEVDVQKLDCDFLVGSGHKLYGPTGIGFVYGKRELLKKLPPFMGGGMMIKEVTIEGFTPADAPYKFEAGTMPIAEAVALQSALAWLQSIPSKEKEAHEAELIRATLNGLQSVPGLQILGPTSSTERYGCVSFTIEGIHPHDLTDLLGQKGYMLRAGNHCAEPLHAYLGVHGSSRISIGLYNTAEEVEGCVEELKKIVQRFS